MILTAVTIFVATALIFAKPAWFGVTKSPSPLSIAARE